MRKRGISLLVLIITIIVIIILAGAIILSLTQSNPTDKAKEAVFKSDVANFRNELETYKITKAGEQIGGYDPIKLNANKNQVEYDGQVDNTKTMLDIITSMKSKPDYTNIFEIREGKLVYIGDNDNEKKWVGDIDIPVNNEIISINISGPTPASIKKGEDVEYNIKFSSNVEITTLNKDKIVLVDNSKNEISEPLLTITDLEGTQTQKAATVKVSTSTLAEGGYGIYVKEGAIKNSDEVLNENTKYSSLFIISKDEETEVPEEPDTPLVAPTISVSPTTTTNSNVTVTITFSEGSSIEEYKLGTGNWQNYSGAIVVSENTTVYARSKNSKGTVSPEASKQISNIDKQNPNITLTVGTITTSTIAVTSNATDTGSGIDPNSYQFSKDNGSTWTTAGSSSSYTFANLVTGTYNIKARVKDKASNMGVSDTLTATTRPITELGNIEILANPSLPTNGNVTMTINYPEGISTKEYKLGTGNWQNYTGAITVTENIDLVARGTDAGGNTLSNSLSIRNIDKVNPNAATITLSASNDKITGNIALSDNADGSGIDLTNSKYIINTISTTYSTSDSVWNSATAMNTNPKAIDETKADGTYYVHVLVVDKAGNKVVSKSNSIVVSIVSVIADPGWDSSKGVNGPVLNTGMTPIKWNGTDWVNTTANDTEWYNYTNKQWANAKTADGSFWVWIPRYEYKIPTPHSSTAQTILINFKQNIATAVTSGYIMHPAFTFGSTQLKGIWVAKFEVGGNVNDVEIKPNIISLRNLVVSDISTISRKMETDGKYGWGTSGKGIDTHLMKNVEWGAVAYLSNSIYGKNSKVWINPNSNYITGQAGDEVNSGTTMITNSYDTTNGMQASTTGNITGIYDMSGGSSEYTAAYINNGYSNLTTYASTLVNLDAKYKDLYTKGPNSQYFDWEENYEANSNKKGDAVYETSSSDNGANSWYDSKSYMPFLHTAQIFVRGGTNTTSSACSIFRFYSESGSGWDYAGFRAVLSVESTL